MVVQEDTPTNEDVTLDDDALQMKTKKAYIKKPKKPKTEQSGSKSSEKQDKSQFRSIRVPHNRYAALQKDWEAIYTPIVEKLELQIRMNTKRRAVELRTTANTTEETALQKAHDFVESFMLGFDIQDSLALLRLDDIYVESFDVKDVKRSLQGDHLSRAIARIAGKGGAVKFTIENATKTRLVIADSRIHILGSFRNIQIARNAVVDLVLGSPPGVVYNKLRVISSRMKESF
jgi:RNA-binding protein PNO1